MKPKLIVTLIVILFIATQAWFAFIMANYSYLGVNVEKRDGQWVVSQIDAKTNVGLKVGDAILEVNGAEADRFSSIGKWRTLERAETIVASRNGNSFIIDASELTKISRMDIFSLAGEIFSLVIAVALYIWMRHSGSAKYLAILFLNIGVTFMSLVASIRGDTLGKSLISTCLMLIPVILLDFLIVFFREKGGIKLPWRFLRYTYAFVLLTFVAQIVSYQIEYTSNLMFMGVYYINVPFFIIGVMINLALLLYIYFKYGKENKYIAAIIKTLWISLLISFSPLICFSFLPQILKMEPLFDTLYTSWVVLFFPLSFTYLLAAKRLYDIDLVIRRFILTTSLSIVPSALLAGVVSFMFSESIESNQAIAFFMITVLLLSCTLYSLEYFTNKLEKVMFPRKYHMQESLKNIAKSLGLISSFRELREMVLVNIIQTLQVFGGAIVFQYDESEDIICEGDIDKAEVKRLMQSGLPEHPSYNGYMIVSNEEYTCYLILTRKKTNTHLGFEETQWLNLIISYLAVSLENIHLIRKLTLKLELLASQIPSKEASDDFAWFRKLMFELQEKERVRIANDLHDTTMQDLFFLKRRCAALMEKQGIASEHAAQINGIIDYIDIIHMNMRQSCFELHPFLLQEIGLIGTIEKLIGLEETDSPVQIAFRADSAAYIENSDLDTKRHLFRIVQELLNNAKKHSEATMITLAFTAEKSRIVLSYEDNGVGFDADFISRRNAGAKQVGVEYMKSRILSMNGQFELTSSPGNGMRFTAVIPLKIGRAAS